MKSTTDRPGRRRFVKFATAATAIALTAPAHSYARIMGSNEQLRMAVVGFKGRGKALIDAIKLANDATLVALCDADRKILTEYDPENRDLFRTQDLREILQREDVDAIASATPNHWHALVTCWACQAGKHVYIEKPISHNMYESRRVAEVAAQNDAVVQCGFQNRSDTGLIPFFDRLHAGEFGRVVSVHGTCHRQRASIGKLDKPLVIPEHIDYDLWLGPAADHEIWRPKLHYDWHWDFNTGNGDVGNQGPHEWDMMNWALGDSEALPTRMIAAGNRFGWNDAGNTPNVMACAGLSGDIPFCFEVMDLEGGRGAPFGKGVGVIIETTRGRFVGGRGGGKFTDKDGRSESFQRDASQQGQDGTPSHMANFVQAARQRDPSLLRSESALAGRSASMAHMANISWQLGQPSSVEALEAAYSDGLQQRDMVARLRESTLLFALQQGTARRPSLPWLLGLPLQFDNASQQFLPGLESANARMTRVYRSDFAV